MEDAKIACPKCDWEPRADDRWMCSCGHIWNTFDTAARCPACGKQWRDTCCLSCQKWSKHLDWYRYPDDWLEELVEELEVVERGKI